MVGKAATIPKKMAPPKGQTGDDVLEELHGGLAGADTRDKPTVLTQVFGDAARVELHCSINVGKPDDQQHLNQQARETVGREKVGDTLR